jgi:flagellar hook-length control protein FliK
MTATIPGPISSAISGATPLPTPSVDGSGTAPDAHDDRFARELDRAQPPDRAQAHDRGQSHDRAQSHERAQSPEHTRPPDASRGHHAKTATRRAEHDRADAAKQHESDRCRGADADGAVRDHQHEHDVDSTDTETNAMVRALAFGPSVDLAPLPAAVLTLWRTVLGIEAPGATANDGAIESGIVSPAAAPATAATTVAGTSAGGAADLTPADAIVEELLDPPRSSSTPSTKPGATASVPATPLPVLRDSLDAAASLASDRVGPSAPVTSEPQPLPVANATTAETTSPAVGVPVVDPNFAATAVPVVDVDSDVATTATIVAAPPLLARADAAPRPEVAPGLAPRVPTPAPAQQLVQVLEPLRSRPDGSYELHLELKPPELGRIEIRVEMRNGVMHAHLRAEQPAAAQAIRDALTQLRDHLTGLGVQTGALNVDAGGTGAHHGHDATSPEPTDRRHDASLDRRADERGAEARPKPLDQIRPRRDGSRLDVHA